MNKIIIRLYNSSPQLVKNVFASLRGYQLNRIRRHNRKENLTILSERDTWSPTQWGEWQEGRLKNLLEEAALNVPYYRAYWESNGGIKEKSYLDLANWPILLKDELRNNPDQFISRKFKKDNLLKIQTSGTSGKPVSVYFTKEVTSFWYSIYEWRIKLANGVNSQDRWANIGGQIVVPVTKNKLPFWVYNSPMKQLYLSSYHISLENTPEYVKALNKYGIIYIWGYTSSIYNIAFNALQLGLENPPNIKLIITNAEPLADYQRETIKKFFKCKVIQTYSSSEQAFGAVECGEGKMHFWPDAGYLETADDKGNILTKGEKGRLIVTGLVNDAMPLIRYDVGDMVQIGTDSCPCKSFHPIISEVLGRFDDIIRTKDGRMIGRLDPVFKADIRIKEAQIIQKKIDFILVLVVPSPGFEETDVKKITNRLIERVGEIKIEVKAVENIPRSSNGKFKAVVSEI